MVTHIIHGTGIFTYIYHTNQPNVGKYTSPMDGMGMSCINFDNGSQEKNTSIFWSWLNKRLVLLCLFNIKSHNLQDLISRIHPMHLEKPWMPSSIQDLFHRIPLDPWNNSVVSRRPSFSGSMDQNHKTDQKSAWNIDKQLKCFSFQPAAQKSGKIPQEESTETCAAGIFLDGIFWCFTICWFSQAILEVSLKFAYKWIGIATGTTTIYHHSWELGSNMTNRHKGFCQPNMFQPSSNHLTETTAVRTWYHKGLQSWNFGASVRRLGNYHPSPLYFILFSSLNPPQLTLKPIIGSHYI